VGQALSPCQPCIFDRREPSNPIRPGGSSPVQDRFHFTAAPSAFLERLWQANRASHAPRRARDVRFRPGGRVWFDPFVSRRQLSI